MANADRSHSSTRSNPGESGSPRGTVLLAEDDRQVRALVRRVLQRARYIVLEAADGREALDVLERAKARVDILITDVVMPRMTGPELAAHAREIAPATPVLFMSGYTDTGRNQNQRLPDDAILLRKPFRPKEVLDRIESMIGK